jgi:glycosyltransferase involved in cell wall biosynthesis
VTAEGYADPLVSVVMPVWNLAPVLPRAIESVLAQTLADIELIIVDDASSDGTPDIIEHYRLADERVRVIRNTTNSRRSSIEWEPRNNGLQIARGAFIAYLDGDNTWDPRALATLSEVLVNSPQTQLAYCRSRNFHDPAEIDAVIAADSRAATAQGEGWVIFAHEELDVTELGRSQYIDTNEMMHRASVFRSLGSLWHTAHPRRAYVNGHQGKRCPYRRHNDLDLAERIIAAFGSDSIVQVAEVLVDYYYQSALRRMLLDEASR